MFELFILGAIDLRDSHGVALDALLRQRHPTALLAYMASAPSGSYFARDRLVTLFWAESDQASARTNLRKALSQLRDALGKDALVSRGDEEIALAPDALRCDAATFEEAFRAKRFARALELYDRGPLLDGFNIATAPEFDRWASDTRARFADMAAAASWRMAEYHQEMAEYTEAGRWARRTIAFRPDDERQLRNALTLLAQNGDRAGAIAVYKRFCEWLRTELDVEPSRETRALVEQIRKG